MSHFDGPNRPTLGADTDPPGSAMLATPETLIPGTWVCALHKDHGSARPIRGAVHHVLPRGAGGPDVASNRVAVCETGHGNVHAVMWAMVTGAPVPPCARAELAMARRGVAEWKAAGRPGSIHAFMG